MHRTVCMALSLCAVACTPATPKVGVAPTASAAAQCKQESASAITYIVDGEAAACAVAMSIPVDRIASVEVLKGAAARLQYGASPAGVVVIQTKRDR